MKVLIFSHGSDIDGMGGVILGKLAFSDVDFILCETYNLLPKIREKIADQTIYNYDKIFITDMWLEDPEIVMDDQRLQNKVLVFDHHESALPSIENKEVDFITIKIRDEFGRCAGTSLFYEYLCSIGALEKNPALDEFVELTRLYDTWEWKTVKNEPRARDLTTLFNAIGGNAYIEIMYNKLQNQLSRFSFNEFEEALIKAKDMQSLKKMQEYSNKIYIREVSNLKAGIIFINYEYRNDFAQYLRDIKFDCDFIMMISMDNGTITYRYVKPGVNVRVIAETFGGKGHDYAATSPINNSTTNQVIDVILQRKLT